MLVEGVKLFLPAGTSALTSERMAHLNAGAAKWQLYEFDERHDELTPIDLADRGNVSTRLVRCPDETAVLERFAESIHRVLSLLPEAEVAVLSTAEVAFHWRGYFPGRELSAQEPLLLLVAPTLHIHPATDTVLRYVDSAIDWTRVGIDERWGEKLKVIFRKRQRGSPREIRSASRGVASPILRLNSVFLNAHRIVRTPH